MRTVKFRDVLWSIARMAGYSPESGNFLTNQALPIGEYVTQWVDRLYANDDWPEWVKLIRLTPDASHIVPYTALPTDPTTVTPYTILRTINVYLVDPTTTNTPVSTKFTLREDGIHVGFEHGTYVYVKYIEPPPRFSSAVWVAENIYNYGDVVYGASTGECYKSRVNNNINHDPVSTISNPALTIAELQALGPGQPGIPASPQTD